MTLSVALFSAVAAVSFNLRGSRPTHTITLTKTQTYEITDRGGPKAPPGPPPRNGYGPGPEKFCETLNGRLPPEDGSVRPETWGKRVSG